MAAREDRERSDALEARQSVLYAVGCICDEEERRQRREPAARAKPAPSKETLALLADLALKQAEVMASELQFFAAHAGRKVIKAEDVLLCARKLPAMARSLEKFQREKFQRETLGGGGGAGGKRRRRNQADGD